MSESRKKEGKGNKKGKKDRKKTEGNPTSPPKLKEIESKTVEEGHKLTLKCEVLSEQPRLKFKWFKEDKEIGGKNKSANIKLRKKKKFCEIQIPKTTEADGGEYKCTVSSEFGNDSKRVNVTICK